MKKLAIAAAVLMLAGCAHAPVKQSYTQSAKRVQTAPVVQPTPNQIVKKRWFPKFKIRWLHQK